MEYKKEKNGHHFYRIGDNILHISHFKEDDTIIKEKNLEDNSMITTITDVKKDDCCINVVHRISDEIIDCSKEEFENKLKEVIFILGIYDFCEKK